MALENGKNLLSLLYVEDEAETRELIVEALEAYFPEVQLQTASNGAEGLRIFQESRPQLVLTDIRMPVMDGIQMAAEIKALDPLVDVIALTAYNDSSFLSTAADIGFSDYVLKPVDYELLFATLEKFLAKHRERA
jgi:YesN/AraC family two-component response regulator